MPVWHSNLTTSVLLALAWTVVDSALANAHGTPIYVSVNQETNQVEVSGSFDDAIIDVSMESDAPGIGVLSQGSGVAAGQIIRLRISQNLLYSNSEQLETTASKVTLYSAEFPQFFEVTAASAIQERLDWAIYPENAQNRWDLDGIFELGPTGAAPGVYGLVAQVLIDGAIDSEPFLIPVVYSPGDIDGSKTALRQAVQLPAPADFTRNWRVDAEDLAAWQSRYGQAGPGVAIVFGDADDDSDIDGADFLEWQRSFNATLSDSNLQSLQVPEPTSGAFLCLAVLIAQRFIFNNRLFQTQKL